MSSQERLRVPISTLGGCWYIGMAWGGLFISVWAFGDASDKIN